MPLDFEYTILLSKENIQVSSIKQSVELIVNCSLQIDFGCVSRQHNRKKIHILIMAFELNSSKTLGDSNESSLENTLRIFETSAFSPNFRRDISSTMKYRSKVRADSDNRHPENSPKYRRTLVSS